MGCILSICKPKEEWPTPILTKNRMTYDTFSESIDSSRSSMDDYSYFSDSHIEYS